MPEVYNVTVTVVARVPAEDELEAITQLQASLMRSGYEPFENQADAFISERLGYEPSPLP